MKDLHSRRNLIPIPAGGRTFWNPTESAQQRALSEAFRLSQWHKLVCIGRNLTILRNIEARKTGGKRCS